jgi:rhamnogalacturonan endolyase
MKWILLLFSAAIAIAAERQMENLGRGLVAVRQEDGTVFLSWRLLREEPKETGFNVYRTTRKLNQDPITNSTCFRDLDAAGDSAPLYSVAAVINGSEQKRHALGFSTGANRYLSIRLQTPDGYSPNDASVGDLDGDGEFEIVLHQVGRGRDNSQPGVTTEPILEAYKFDGTLLWRINLGRNIREGAHYTQFIVYDLDGDGRAEIACKTADGTRDGKGKIIGDPDADWRSMSGRSAGKILAGPEFLTVFDGLTGAALATTDYIPERGKVADWGDDYGNRVDRFLACVAYLDGKRPSLIMCRGYYTRSVLAAWNWRQGKLTHVWTFDSDDGPSSNRSYRGQGNHNLSVADVDDDGMDEIIYGAAAIDHDGKGLYSTGLGHGDALHISDLDPEKPGVEVFNIQERFDDAGANFRNARTGEVYWKKPSVQAGRDGEGPGRGAAFDIDPRHYGHECWVAGAGVTGLFNVRGEKISETAPRTCNMGIWWDGDLLRELLNGVTITKWDYERSRELPLFSAADFECAANNGTKSNPALCADILGDWREEIIARTRDNKELRIFTTTIPTNHRFRTLMHDPVYRLGIVWQNVAYNQPAHTGFYLGAERPSK